MPSPMPIITASKGCHSSLMCQAMGFMGFSFGDG